MSLILDVETRRQEMGSGDLIQLQDQMELHYFNVVQTSSTMGKLAGMNFKV